MKKYEKEIDKFTRKLESMRKNPLGRALKYDNNFNNKFYLAHYVKILSSAHVICDKINYMLDYKASHKFDMIGIIQSIFSDNNGIRSEINN